MAETAPQSVQAIQPIQPIQPSQLLQLLQPARPLLRQAIHPSALATIKVSVSFAPCNISGRQAPLLAVSHRALATAPSAKQ
jgi:hypothetical protein